MSKDIPPELLRVARLLNGYAERLQTLAALVRSKHPPSPIVLEHSLRTLAGQLQLVTADLKKTEGARTALGVTLLSMVHAFLDGRGMPISGDPDSGVDLSKPPTFEIGDGKGEE